MGVFRGSISYSKFYVRDPLPAGFRDRFVERARLRAFAPLTVDDDAQERSGWCSVDNPLDFELDHDKLYFNAYLNVGFRVDRWQIPGPLFKAHFAIEEQNALKTRSRSRLTKQEELPNGPRTPNRETTLPRS